MDYISFKGDKKLWMKFREKAKKKGLIFEALKPFLQAYIKSEKLTQINLEKVNNLKLSATNVHPEIKLKNKQEKRAKNGKKNKNKD